MTLLTSWQGPRGWGIRAVIGGLVLDQPHPVATETLLNGIRRRARGYDAVQYAAGEIEGVARVALAGSAALVVVDSWSLEGSRLRVRRDARVEGSAPKAAFLTSLRLRLAGPLSWRDVEPFAPGLTYGNSERVPRWSIGSPEARRRGVRWIVAREDRMAAPVFAVRLHDGRWLAVRHTDPTGGTVTADGEDIRGGVLVDRRLETAALGGVAMRDQLEIGLWYPGTEGEATYESGGLPLRQRRAWRRRYHPAEEGVRQHYAIDFSVGHADDPIGYWSGVWRTAYDAMRPSVTPIPAETLVPDAVRVLAGQVRTGSGVTGIPLEVDPTTTEPLRPLGPAIMGFVGANTDAGELLVRLGQHVDGDASGSVAASGAAILDTFAQLPLDPPAGEGFDLETGRVTTYRRIGPHRAVFARSIAEGCRASLSASNLDVLPTPEGGARWRGWALSGASWLLASQTRDGAIPRAWVAGSGRTLQASSSATSTVVPFLVDAAHATSDDQFLDAAVRAGEHAWRGAGGRDGAFSGATLDNPDVVDKEASVLALEAFLALHRSTGERAWLERAVVAAQVAETWVYAWDIPVPVEAESASLGWKPGVPTTGLQLITTGVSMADGFLAVNAAAFARLAESTGDEHWLDVARLVTWGPKAMLAVAGRTFDLAGPGWAQEHWSLATRRGHGLNRSWLPWVCVATIRGLVRLSDETPDSAARLLASDHKPQRATASSQAHP